MHTYTINPNDFLSTNATPEEIPHMDISLDREYGVGAAAQLREFGFGRLADEMLNAGSDRLRGEVLRKYFLETVTVDPGTCTDNTRVCIRHITNTLDECRTDKGIWETRMELTTCDEDTTVLITHGANQVVIGSHMETLPGNTAEAAQLIHRLVRTLPASVRRAPIVNPVVPTETDGDLKAMAESGAQRIRAIRIANGEEGATAGELRGLISMLTADVLRAQEARDWDFAEKFGEVIERLQRFEQQIEARKMTPKQVRLAISKTLMRGPSALTEEFIQQIGNHLGRFGIEGLALVLFNIAGDKARHSYRHWLFEARKALAEVA